jgi:hypothetical protein
MVKKLSFGIRFLVVSIIASYAASAIAGLPIIVASDSASDPAYSPQPDHDYGMDNGGFGYNTWTGIDGGGGNTYMEGPGVNGRGVPTTADFSFALFSGGEISRPLTSSLAFGEFDIFTRFDTNGSNLDLVNLRSGNDTTAFGNGELLSFGIVNGTALSYTDASGPHLLPSGDARGSVYSWNVDFNAAAGTYSLTVNQVGGAFTDTVSGSLEASGTTVGSFAVIDTSSGSNQNVIFNDPTFSVPEPSTIAAGALAFCGVFFLRRRPRTA